MKIRKLNESEELDRLEKLREVLINAESDIIGIYATVLSDSDYINLKDINVEIKDIVQRLRRFQNLISEKIDKK